MIHKRLIYKILVALLILVISALSIFIGYNLYYEGFDMMPYVEIAFGGILLVLIIYFVNLFIIRKFKNRRINADLMEDKVFEKKKFAEEHYDEYYKKVKRHIFFADLYSIFILLLLLTIFVNMCFLIFADDVFIVLAFFAGITLFISISFIIGKDIPKDAMRNEIKENEFPHLWDIINRVAAKFAIKKSLKCFVTYNNNACVLELDRYIEIFLGIQLVFLVNEEELENILIHEFAHIHLNHTSRSIIINKRIELWKNLNDEKLEFIEKFARVLFYPIYGFLNLDFDVFQMVSSSQKEDEADKYIIEKGNVQAHINALAKMNVYNFFLYDEGYPINEVYEPEVITDKYYFMMYDKFIEYYEKNKDLWCSLILKRIPARIETHQPFKNRMELLGVRDFNIDFSRKIPEIEKLANFASKLIMDDFKSEYEEQRKIQYLNNKDLIDKYEAGEAKYNQLKLFDLAYAYRKMGRLQDAIAIYDKLIAELGERPKLLYSKGVTLLNLYEDTGIEYIYKAMELNSSLLKSGINLISEYCLKMGLADELEKIRAYLKEHRDYVINVQVKINVNYKDKFLKTELSQEVVKEVVGDLSKDNRIEKIFMVDKIIDKIHRITVVGISVKSEYIDDLKEVLDIAFDYLDDARREEFFLLSLNYYPAFFKKFMSIPLALKYQSK